ncbi:ADP-ribosylglycohydrolase family protein [Dactylosporangium darangshiense]|uniref:ADP-ribosylglycohydrolase family protein n=1 Tax=Dactylosporangium darangshiense TaxID=579108 RepID=UPI003640ADB5
MCWAGGRYGSAGGGCSAVQSDRAAGVLVGAACGDALGVPYEFQPPLAAGHQPEMCGGGLGPYAPVEYSDDTQMAVCIAEVSASGADLRSSDSLDRIAANFLRWRREGASDIGAQTRQVLGAVSHPDGAGLAAAMRDAATDLHRRTGRSAGNGSLMRTAPVALAYLGRPDALAEAARAVSELTNHDVLAGDACVLWCSGIRRAIIDATFDGVREGLDLVPAQRRDQWSNWLTEAESKAPEQFRPNGFVVPALQAAWSAITHTAVPDHDPARGSFACQHLQHALTAAVCAGDDTDTVAAIAGALLGARWGSSAVPLAWQRVVHGWPTLRAADLIRLAVLTAQGGQTDSTGWPGCARAPRQPVGPLLLAHPHDPGVILGNLRTDAAAATPVRWSPCAGSAVTTSATWRPPTGSRRGWSTSPAPTRTRTSSSTRPPGWSPSSVQKAALCCCTVPPARAARRRSPPATPP